MDVVIQSRTIKLLSSMFDRKTPNTSVVKTKPQKISLQSKAVGAPLKRGSPEQCGVSSDLVRQFICELHDNGKVFPHCVMIVKDGNVIGECAYSPYSFDIMHVTHSLCKSITGIAVCMLIDDGKLSLDDSIGQYFEDYLSPLNILRPVKITVRQLMTMTSDIVFNEAGVVTDTEWIKSFLESNKTAHGDVFNYNSMNTFMLSALVRQITGKPLDEFLAPRLFEPLGITDWYWEKSPDGNCKGGWGLYMHLEDLAKIGVLLVNKGEWNGNRIISEDMVRSMTSIQVSAPISAGSYDYGLQTWVGRIGSEAENSFVFNGMLGQNIVCFPEKQLVVACFAGNSSMFQQNDFFAIVNRYFGKSYSPNRSLPADLEAEKKLRQTESFFASVLQNNTAPKRSFKDKILALLGLSKKEKVLSVPEKWLELNGKNYVFPVEYTAAVGLIPLVIQTLQNNFSDGLNSIAFDLTDNSIRLTFNEGSCSHIIEPGIDCYKDGEIYMHGETYKIASRAKFCFDEDDNPVLKLDIAFTETANVRKIKIYLLDGRIFVKLTETPGMEFILDGIEATIGDIRSNKIMDLIFSHADTDYIVYKMKTVLEPEFTGKPE